MPGFFTGLFWRSAAPKRVSLHLAGIAGLALVARCWSQEPEGPCKPPGLASCCVCDPADSAGDVPWSSTCRAEKGVRTLTLIPFLSWFDQELVKLQSSFWAIIRDALMRGEFYSLLAWPEILSTTVTSSTEVPAVPSAIASLSANTPHLSWLLESVPICRAKVDSLEALQMVMSACFFFFVKSS